MDEWRARHKSVLNLIKYMRHKSAVMLQRRFTQLGWLQQICSGNETAMHEVMVHLLTYLLAMHTRYS